MTERRDPVLGALPHLDEAAAASVRAPQCDRAGAPRVRRAWRWWVGAGLAIVLAAVFALNHWRAAIGARLVPPAQQADAMQEAAAALRAGKLTATDGHGARELYVAVLARDPDSLAAREGLVRVGSAALAQARAALRSGDEQQARNALDLARSLDVPVADLQSVEAQLQQNNGSVDQIAKLLTQAGAAESAGHLDDGDRSALALYQQALAASPGNAVVLARRQALLARMLGGIQATIAKGDVVGAQKLVDRVAAIDPGDLDLPAARARVGEVVEQHQQEQTRALDAADADLRDGRLDEAVAGYRKVLAGAPANQRARGGLRAVAEALVADSRRAMADQDLARAEPLLAQAREIAPDLATLHAAEQSLRQAHAHRRGSENKRVDNPKIDDLLAAADHAIVRSELVDPPGDSAYDKLRAASAIAPGDPRVAAAIRRFAATAIACYQREMTGNRLVRAQACFDALGAIQPTYPKLPSMRQELAARWLAYADERIGAGEFAHAQRGIASAKQLMPNDPAIPALQTRLQQARAGTKR